jgi:DNA-binding MarR family transcriptional regulator
MPASMNESAPPTPLYDGARYEYGTGVGFWLKRAAAALTRAVEQDMTAHGLTDAQWFPLLLLCKTPTRTAADLAKVLDYDAGAVTRLVDRLEAKGLVTRCRSTDDRRVVYLDLTDEGRKAAEQVPFVIADLMNRTLRGFTRAEHDTLLALLRRLAANVDARPADGFPPLLDDLQKDSAS